MNGLKKHDFLEHLLSMYFAEYEYYREAWDRIQAIEPTMLDLRSKKIRHD